MKYWSIQICVEGNEKIYFRDEKNLNTNFGTFRQQQRYYSQQLEMRKAQQLAFNMVEWEIWTSASNKQYREKMEI